MRMMLKIQMPVGAGSAAITSGSLPEIIGNLTESIHPECAYFFAEDGKRSALMVFEMTSSEEIPAIVEPLFMGFDASVTLTPVMNGDELEAGLAAWGAGAA